MGIPLTPPVKFGIWRMINGVLLLTSFFAPSIGTWGGAHIIAGFIRHIAMQNQHPWTVSFVLISALVIFFELVAVWPYLLLNLLAVRPGKSPSGRAVFWRKIFLGAGVTKLLLYPLLISWLFLQFTVWPVFSWGYWLGAVGVLSSVALEYAAFRKQRLPEQRIRR